MIPSRRLMSELESSLRPTSSSWSSLQDDYCLHQQLDCYYDEDHLTMMTMTTMMSALELMMMMMKRLDAPPLVMTRWKMMNMDTPPHNASPPQQLMLL